ncbi:MAG: RHS repeat-associated core domain-containing protein [Acidimicrobiales bacterium]
MSGPGGTTAYTYDLLGRQTAQTNPAGLTSSVTYDGAGNITSYTDPGGTVTYGYDPANNLVTLAEPGGSCVGNVTDGCTTFGYNNNDQLTSEYLPNADFENWDYDGEGRMLDQVVLPTGTGIANHYDYQASSGADTSLLQSTTNDAVPGGQTTSYSYDSLNRLVGANTAGGTYDLYGYDADGNMTSASANGGQSYSYSSYNGADELTGTAATFDASGNETTLPSGAALAYDAASQTVQATPPGAPPYPLGYDGPSQDLLNTDSTNTYLANTLLGTGSVTEGGTTAYFTRTPSGALISMRINGTSYYYITNYQGSVQLVLDPNGPVDTSYSYDAWGNLTAASGTVGQPFGYIGAYYDASVGLYHLGARWYDPTQPRFTQLDPSAQDPGYAYAGDNPVNICDPAGTDVYFFRVKPYQAIAIGGVALTAFFVISLRGQSLGVAGQYFKAFLGEAGAKFGVCGIVAGSLKGAECEATIVTASFKGVGRPVPVSITVEVVGGQKSLPKGGSSCLGNGGTSLAACVLGPFGRGDLLPGDPFIE